MTRYLAVLLASSVIAFPAAAALQQGATAPAFTAQASLAGKTFTYSLKDALKKGPVVVYFYPSAFTGGCNAQAHAFSENKEKFSAAGATIIGVSLDSIARLNDFSADPEYCAGKIAVASDVDGKIAKSYGLTVTAASPGMKDSRGAEINHGFAERTTFIVSPEGKIVATVGGVAATVNVTKSLEAVEQYAAKGK
jgi:thioredoxin-dependent peroxiredoxin